VQKRDLLSPKITRSRRAVGMAQEVEPLMSKCKALSSNSSITKKKRNVQETPEKCSK
jgi:hypothetical protein